MDKETVIHDPFENNISNLPAWTKENHENPQKHLIFKLFSPYIDPHILVYSHT